MTRLGAHTKAGQNCISRRLRNAPGGKHLAMQPLSSLLPHSASCTLYYPAARRLRRAARWLPPARATPRRRLSTTYSAGSPHLRCAGVKPGKQCIAHTHAPPAVACQQLLGRTSTAKLTSCACPCSLLCRAPTRASWHRTSLPPAWPSSHANGPALRSCCGIRGCCHTRWEALGSLCVCVCV